jgi:hypothetical protein
VINAMPFHFLPHDQVYNNQFCFSGQFCSGAATKPSLFTLADLRVYSILSRRLQ